MARKSQTFSEYAAERGIKVTPDFTIDRRGNFYYPLKDEEQSRRQRKALADYRKLVESGAIHDPTLERAAKAGKTVGEENPIDETGQQQNRFPLFRLLIFSCPIFVLGGRWIMRNLFQRAGNAVRNVAGRIRSAFSRGGSRSSGS